MKIQDLIADKGDRDQVSVEGCRASVSALRRLMEGGYEHIRVYGQTKTFSLWGKSCTACFSEEQMADPS
jgi:hypothetical protein